MCVGRNGKGMGNAAVKSNQVAVSSESPSEILKEDEAKNQENTDYLPNAPPPQEEKIIDETDETDDSPPPLKSVGLKKGFSVKSRMMSGIGTLGSDGDEDADAIDILFELIPYHGQGDGSNDTIFRSALSAASVEDIDRKDSYGNTLLLSSCQYRLEPVVRILLNKGADPNAANSAGASCLHFACYKDSLSKNIAKLLLQNGANPDVQELTYGCTPLHYAASSGDFDLCKTLISFGAEVKTLDYYEYTCSDYAREGGFAELATYLQTKLLMVASQQNLSHFGNTTSDPSSIHRSSQSNVDPALRSNSLTSKPSLTAQLSILPHSSASSIVTPTIDHDQHQLRNSLPVPSPRIGSDYASPPSPPPHQSLIEESWVAQTDISTSEKYYMNMMTGECLWEADYIQHREALARTYVGSLTPEKEKETPSKALVHGAIFSPSQKSLLDQGRKLSSNASFKLSTSLSGSAESTLQEEILHLQSKIQEIQTLSEQTLEKNQADFRHQLLEKEMKLVQLDTIYQQSMRENERLEVTFPPSLHVPCSQPLLLE